MQQCSCAEPAAKQYRQNFEKSGPAIWVYCGIALIINERKNQPPAVQMHKAGGWFYKS